MDEKIIAVDVETYRDGDPFCISFTDTKLHQVYRRWNRFRIPRVVLDILMDERIPKALHNAHFDLGALRQIGVEVRGKIHDTLLMAQLSLPHQKSYKLKELMRDKELPFQKECKEYELVQKYSKLGYTYDRIPGALMKKYNMKDTYYTMLLYAYLEKTTNDPIYKLERRLIRTVVDMESNGIRVDVNFSKLKLEAYQERLDEISGYFQKKHGLENINSSKQVSELLYDKLELDPPQWKGKEHYSTDYLALVLLKDSHPCIKKIIEHRRMATKVRMFLRPFVEKNKSGNMHPNFNQLGEVGRHRIKTGRFSSSNPNFQNIERGSDIRELLKPREGYYFLDYDYNQIEMRLYAYLARDKAMMKTYEKGGDIHILHKQTFVDPYRKDFDGKNRQIAKNIGFEIIYGIGAPGMTNFLHKQGIHLNQQVVGLMLDRWHMQHPSLTDFRRKLYQQHHRGGFIEDNYGRRYFLPLAKNYMAVNYIIQGMSANIIKDAMPNVNRYVKSLKGRQLLTIHDELLLELPLKYYKTREEEDIKEIMEAPKKKIGIPLVVDYQRMKRNWGEKK